MQNRTLILVISSLCALSATATANAGVYKCSDGPRVVYSDKPCPNAKPVDTTNAASPTLSDQYSAEARVLRDKAKIQEAELNRLREEKARERCEKLARDNNWTTATAQKYQTDQWWQNRAKDSTETLRDECSQYLIPAGAGYRQ